MFSELSEYIQSGQVFVYENLIFNSIEFNCEYNDAMSSRGVHTHYTSMSRNSLKITFTYMGNLMCTSDSFTQLIERAARKFLRSRSSIYQDIRGCITEKKFYVSGVAHLTYNFGGDRYLLSPYNMTRSELRARCLSGEAIVVIKEAEEVLNSFYDSWPTRIRTMNVASKATT